MPTKDVNMVGGDRLPIKEFHLEKMCNYPSIVMIAKRGSGKSIVCKAIMKHFKDIPVGIVIAKTEKMNCFYGEFFPDTYIFYEYKSEIIENLLRRQEVIIETRKKKKLKGKCVDKRSFIVMDDCLSQKGTWMKDPPISELLYNGRHYGIMYILTMQYSLGITPELRCNFDYIFLLAEDFITNMKRIYDHYAGMFPTFQAFKQVFTQLTEDFGCMVIANRGARSDFLDKVYWYKAPYVENDHFMVGCKQFRLYHDKNYNTNWSDPKNKKFDVEKFCADKKNSKSNVRVEFRK